MLRPLAPLALFLFALPLHAACTDSLVLDNVASLVAFDVDTTGHWWSITQPYAGFQQLVIDGKDFGTWDTVHPPVFAFDGSTWAARAVRSGESAIITPDGTRRSPVTIEGIAFPPQHSVLWWVEFDGVNRKVTNGERSYVTGYPANHLRFDPQGLAVSWIEFRPGQHILMQNGREVARGDNLALAGVWADGRCLYIRTLGLTSNVLLGEEELTGAVRSVTALRINPLGSVATWQATDGSGQVRTYIYTDEYNAPWEGPVVAQADPHLTLSPFDPLVAYRTVFQGGRVVAFNAAMYPHGSVAGRPTFSHDGAIMAYTSKDNGDFVVLNGKRFLVNAGVPIEDDIAVSPTGRSVAWRSGTTLVVVNVDPNTLQMGRMCDAVGRVIYDRRTKSYVALGVVTGRLFMLRCPAT